MSASAELMDRLVLMASHTVISIWGPFGYVRLKRGSDCPEPEAA